MKRHTWLKVSGIYMIISGIIGIGIAVIGLVNGKLLVLPGRYSILQIVLILGLSMLMVLAFSQSIKIRRSSYSLNKALLFLQIPVLILPYFQFLCFGSSLFYFGINRGHFEFHYEPFTNLIISFENRGFGPLGINALPILFLILLLIEAKRNKRIRNKHTIGHIPSDNEINANVNNMYN